MRYFYAACLSRAAFRTQAAALWQLARSSEGAAAIAGLLSEEPETDAVVDRGGPDDEATSETGEAGEAEGAREAGNTGDADTSEISVDEIQAEDAVVGAHVEACGGIRRFLSLFWFDFDFGQTSPLGSPVG